MLSLEKYRSDLSYHTLCKLYELLLPITSVDADLPKKRTRIILYRHASRAWVRHQRDRVVGLRTGDGEEGNKESSKEDTDRKIIETGRYRQ